MSKTLTPHQQDILKKADNMATSASYILAKLYRGDISRDTITAGQSAVLELSEQLQIKANEIREEDARRNEALSLRAQYDDSDNFAATLATKHFHKSIPTSVTDETFDFALASVDSDNKDSRLMVEIAYTNIARLVNNTFTAGRRFGTHRA